MIIPRAHLVGYQYNNDNNNNTNDEGPRRPRAAPGRPRTGGSRLTDSNYIYICIYIYIYIYILRRYESLTHFSPVVVESVCGGYLACGLPAGLRCGYPPSPLRHLSC